MFTKIFLFIILTQNLMLGLNLFSEFTTKIPLSKLNAENFIYSVLKDKIVYIQSFEESFVLTFYKSWAAAFHIHLNQRSVFKVRGERYTSKGIVERDYLLARIRQ
jgi:hypothetical protein